MSIPTTTQSAQDRRPSDGESVARVKGFKIDSKVLSSIRSASRDTGVDFGYLMAQAAQESGFDTQARASTSNATGLYQFLDQTWLGMVKQHGAAHGLGAYADQIQPSPRGGYTVADPVMRQKILNLRTDPTAAAALGAEFALSNKADLESSLGHGVGSTELYLAHFLGAGGATRFLKEIARNGAQPAADLMPQAADANRNVFYEPETGRARSVSDIYKMFSKSIESKSAAFAVLDDGSAAHAATPVAVAQDGATGGGGGGVYEGPGLSSVFMMLALAALDMPLNSKPADGEGGTDADRANAAQAYRKLTAG